MNRYTAQLYDPVSIVFACDAHTFAVICESGIKICS